MKYTKGPWHRNLHAQGKYPIVYAGRNTHVAQVMQQPTPEETEANIDLVAAAPELAEALRLDMLFHSTLLALSSYDAFKAAGYAGPSGGPAMKDWLHNLKVSALEKAGITP